MDILRLTAAGTLLIVVGCTGRDVLAPAAPASSDFAHAPASPAVAAGRIETSGLFDANVNFSTLQLTPRGSNCLLDVDGQFVFHGTIQGVANGHTSALVFATCADVASKPPGTHADVFTSKATFEGTVGGQPASAKVLYQGRVQPGGHISGHLIFSDGVSGELSAEAQVAVGGSYSGSLVVH